MGAKFAHFFHMVDNCETYTEFTTERRGVEDFGGLAQIQGFRGDLS